MDVASVMSHLILYKSDSLEPPPPVPSPPKGREGCPADAGRGEGSFPRAGALVPRPRDYASAGAVE